MYLQGDMEALRLEGRVTPDRASDHEGGFARCGAIFIACSRRIDDGKFRQRSRT